MLEIDLNKALKTEEIKKTSAKKINTKESFFSDYQIIKGDTEEEEIFNKYGFSPAINNQKEVYIITYQDNLKNLLSKESDKKPLKLLTKYSQTYTNIIIVSYAIFSGIKEQYSLIDKNYDESEAKMFYKDLLTDASRKNATDIHLTWMSEYVSIRYRLDGILIEQPKKIDRNLGLALKNIFVNLTGESEYEQNEIAGGFHDYIDNTKSEYRLSIGPTVQGFVIVIRIEHKISKDSNLESLGYSPKAITTIRKLFMEKHGLVLVTGQTGSGKSTLLYTSAVERLYKDTIRIPQILTVEDPVEMVVDGMNQVQVNTKGEKENWITFTSAIKMFLRQNPDMIIVGEIRNNEVAIQAITAAKTGHLTASTLHTNNVKSTFPRLRELGVDNANIEDGVRGIISQSLIQKLCSHCKEEEIINGERYFKRSKSGCNECAGSSTIGIKGRVPVVETAVLNSELYNYLPENYVDYYSLEENIHYLLKEGLIDLKEANRVVKIDTNSSLHRRNFILEQWNKATKTKDGEHIFPVYQGIVDHNNYTLGYESFMRMKDADGNLIYPDTFLNLLKEMDLYHNFSTFILDQIIAFSKKTEKKVFWNIEKENIEDPEFFELLTSKLNDINLLNKIVLELVYENNPKFNSFIKKCNEHKIVISLDHFEGNMQDLIAIERNGLEIGFIKTTKNFIDGYSYKEEWIKEYMQLCQKVKASIIMNFIETASMFEEFRKQYTNSVYGYQGYGIQMPSTFN